MALVDMVILFFITLVVELRLASAQQNQRHQSSTNGMLVCIISVFVSVNSFSFVNTFVKLTLYLGLSSREEVDAFHESFVKELIPLGGSIVYAPKDGSWAPGYRSSLYHDPDNIRIEMNFVPSKGLLGLDKPQVFGKL